MNCLEFRRIRLSDPDRHNAELDTHRLACPTCSAFEADILQLDKRLLNALNVEVPQGLAARVLLKQDLHSEPSRPTRWSWLSLAASFLLAGIFSFYQISAPASIDAALVAHINAEQPVVDNRIRPVQEVQIRQVLNSINLDSDHLINDIKFAANCIVNDRLVGHFVLERDQVSYTFVVLPPGFETNLSEFSLDSKQGVLLPQTNGTTIAVIADAGQAPVSHNTLLSLAADIGSAIQPFETH